VRGAVGTAALMCVYYAVTTLAVSRSNHSAIRASRIYCVTWRTVPERTRPKVDHDMHCILPSGIIGNGTAKHEQRCEQRVAAIQYYAGVVWRVW